MARGHPTARGVGGSPPCCCSSPHCSECCAPPGAPLPARAGRGCSAGSTKPLELWKPSQDTHGAEISVRNAESSQGGENCHSQARGEPPGPPAPGSLFVSLNSFLLRLAVSTDQQSFSKTTFPEKKIPVPAPSWVQGGKHLLSYLLAGNTPQMCCQQPVKQIKAFSFSFAVFSFDCLTPGNEERL